MPSRVVLLVAWVGFVAALAVYVMTSGPSDNDIVYRYETQVEASVDVVDPAFEVTVAGVSSRQLEEVEPWGSATAAVVVTVTPTSGVSVPSVTIDSEAATVTGADDHIARPTTVRGDDQLDAGVPTVVMLAVEQPVEVFEGSFNFVATTPTVPVQVTVPILEVGKPIATVTATLTPVEITGDELGIAGAVDIPDQRLPRPAVAEAIPTQLDDGRPVWVVGLDDTVAVLDARSPHRYSGLVGWCGSMPGFTDSIGGSRFTAAGGYRFGPAPHGLIPYEVEVAADHVVITHRLPPPPWPLTTPTDMTSLPAIEGSPVEQGPYCENDAEIAAQAGEDGAFLEDFTGDPTWVQHALADWPPLDGATGDGWFRTDEHDLADGGPHLAGDLLVHRERGVIDDAASPPGTARTLLPSGDEPAAVTCQYEQIGPPVNGVRQVLIQPVMWVTSTGIFPADTPPDDTDRHLASTQPSMGYWLADDVEIDVSPGDVITLTIVDQQVADISSIGSD